jgi:hypothetical protein
MCNETNESIETVIDVSYKTVRNAKACALLFAQLDKVLNKDQNGKVSFRTYAIAWRRIYVGKVFDGKNTEELAKMFNISDQTIQNDIKWFRENQRKKFIKVPLLAN